MRPWPAGARVAAIDLGKARAGLAVSDELGLLAHPRPACDARSHRVLLGELARLAREDGVARFLVGLPLALDGRPGAAARRAARFCQRLADVTGVEVEVLDERLTTVEANARLRAAGCSRAGARRRVDSEAAAILLQQWLDAHRGPP